MPAVRAAACPRAAEWISDRQISNRDTRARRKPRPFSCAVCGYNPPPRGAAVDVDPNTVRYPDVDVAGRSWQDLKAESPAVIAEILSPSSVTNDLGDKAPEYLRLESVSAYLVLSQDEPKAWVWIRSTTGLAAGADIVLGANGVIRISPLSVDLPLSEIYAGFAPANDDS